MRMTPYSVYWTPRGIYWHKGLYAWIVEHPVDLPMMSVEPDPFIEALMSIINAEGWSGEDSDPFFTATLKSRCCNADVTRHTKFGADPHDDTVWYFCTECGEECEVQKQRR